MILMFTMNFSIVSAFVYRLFATMGNTYYLHSWAGLAISVSVYLLFILSMVLSFCYAAYMARGLIQIYIQEVIIIA